MENNVDTSPAPPIPSGTFAYLPVGLFGSVMGLTGLSVAWHLAHDRFGLSRLFADAIGVVAVIVFLLVAGGYAVKLVTASQAVRAEFAHPTRAISVRS